MNCSIFVILAFAAVAQAIDWSNVRPMEFNPPIRGLPSFFNKGGEGRIVGGDEVKPHARPFQAALIMTLNNGQQAFCGGSLISPNFVMTAAHCADGIKSIEVILGAHNAQENEDTQVRMTSTDFIVHEAWSSLLIKNDIALIRLPKEVQLNDNIGVVALPTKADAANHFVGAEATVSGWGKTADNSGISSVLRQVTNEVMTNIKCSLSYPFHIHAGHICVTGSGHKSSCNGDSGGPLTVTENGITKIIGIVSFGRNTCEQGHPSVYTRVTEYESWIAKHTGIELN